MAAHAMAVIVAATWLAAGSANAQFMEASGDTSPEVSCWGDCSGDGRVTIDEVILLVNIALGHALIDGCSAAGQTPGIDDIVSAVDSLLFGCDVITYHLIQGSALVVSLRSTNGIVSIHEPLTGLFAVKQIEPPPVKNTFFYYRIVSMDLRGDEDITIRARAGSISASTQVLNQISAFVPAVINDSGAQLSGAGPSTGFPRLQQLEICGPPDPPHAVSCDAIREGREEGYSVTIFAEPISSVDSE
jgi:hypothetical protein